LKQVFLEKQFPESTTIDKRVARGEDSRCSTCRDKNRLTPF
jgi:hypothetical protein